MASTTQNETTNLVIYAPGIHTGGGLALLRALLESQILRSCPNYLLLDARCLQELDIPDQAKLYQIEPSISGRLKAELYLKRVVGHKDTVICLHSLPPLFKLRGHVVCFLQNILHLGAFPLSGYPMKARLRLSFERFVGHALRSLVDTYIVQTESMKQRLLGWHRSDPRVVVCPFVSLSPDRHDVSQARPPEVDFIYVADGLPHKNHGNLLEAWMLLAERGIYPKLGLTLSSRDRRLAARIGEMCDKHQLNINNFGTLAHEDLYALYRTSRALIFPSFAESLGLPLIEAEQVGLPIVAAELDYVRDVCRPVETFDPASPRSIARAVGRFLSIDGECQRLHSPDSFLRTAMTHEALNPVECTH